MSRKYYNTNWTLHICSDCGVDFYYKFQNSTLCMKCLDSFHVAMHDKLEYHRKREKEKIREFIINYKSKK